MFTSCQGKRWAITAGAVVVLLGGLFPPAARAQMPPGRTLPSAPKKYHNKTFFDLPITIEEPFRASVREVVLFVREANGEWTRKMAVPVTQRFFRYRVPGDGEYAFSVATVDTLGRQNPPDVRQEPPGLIVVVDTQPPIVTLTPVQLPSGLMAVRCQVIDANPNPQKLELVYKAADQTWRPLQRLVQSHDMFALPERGSFDGTIRVTAVDLAGNATTRLVSASEITPAPNGASGQRQPIVPTNHHDHVPSPINPPMSLAHDLPPPPPAQTKEGPPVITPPSHHVAHQGVRDAMPPDHLDMPPTGAPPSALPPVPGADISPLPPAAPGAAKSGHRQLIRSPRAAVEYRIDKVGPSGVSKVDVWVRGEREGMWQLLCSDKDLKSPADIDLPGEGVYGIRLVLTNGNGFGGQPPASHDPAELWIEVDTTPPFAQLTKVEPASGTGAIDIHWTVNDKNLGKKAVSLSYATQKGGPWLPIAQHIDNSGQYSWQFPRNLGAQFYVRLEVSDEAGNTTIAETPNPILLDLTIPSASVIGVSGVRQR